MTLQESRQLILDVLDAMTAASLILTMIGCFAVALMALYQGAAPFTP